VSERASRDHYSYTLYSDPHTARTFDDRRFGGPIGELVASTQATVLTRFIGPLANRTLLDVGTGTGRAALLMARAGARVTGVDASDEMLAVARQRAAAEGAAMTFQTGDAHALDFPNRSFEVVISLRVIMHTPRWADCVAELCRVADQLVILDYPSSRSTALFQSQARRLLAAVGRRTEPYRVFSYRQIDDALRRSGFRVRSVHRQFVLPIALHKAVGSRRLTVTIEGWLERLGLLRLFGSPVTVVAERCAP
jgi:2-polyprenyl-3-methyl-5-hydroxy-6-metoxy-1,4-benzoquinol methylase